MTGPAAAAGTATRLAAVLIGLGLLLAAAPVAAATRGPDREEAAALRLLEEAVRAAQTLTYSGTKYVAAWRSSGASTSLVDVRHTPVTGLVLTASPTAAGAAEDDRLVVAATTLDPALLDVLADTYELALAGEGRCAGRDAEVVEARRPDGGTVAGRFWVDRETGLLLRREVYDEQGRRLRSSAFVDLSLTAAGPVAGARTVARSAGAVVPSSRLRDLRDDGWTVPDDLPGGFALFDVREKEHGGGQVLQLAYSDGLSTTALFVQRGKPGGEPPDGFVRRDVAGHPVWLHDGAPERIVWAGDDRVWTLVSDAPEGLVADAVGALPHDAMPEPGFRARLGRGLSRLGSWLNPFD